MDIGPIPRLCLDLIIVDNTCHECGALDESASRGQGARHRVVDHRSGSDSRAIGQRAGGWLQIKGRWGSMVRQRVRVRDDGSGSGCRVVN